MITCLWYYHIENEKLVTRCQKNVHPGKTEVHFLTIFTH